MHISSLLSRANAYPPPAHTPALHQLLLDSHPGAVPISEPWGFAMPYPHLKQAAFLSHSHHRAFFLVLAAHFFNVLFSDCSPSFIEGTVMSLPLDNSLPHCSLISPTVLNLNTLI